MIAFAASPPAVSYLSPSASGSAIITVTVSDGQSENSTTRRSITVNVNAAASASALSALPDLTLQPNAGTQKVQLTGIASSNVTDLTVIRAKLSKIPVPTLRIKAASSSLSGTADFVSPVVVP